MASPSSSSSAKLLQLLLLRRRLSRSLKPLPSSSSIQRSSSFLSSSSSSIHFLLQPFNSPTTPTLRSFCSQGPVPIDYHSVLQEDEFHNLADSAIHGLLEKIEEYGDSIEIDGFDIDYGNQVLTVKLGSLGTYVLNKQTPNRQIWMSSPVSGPSRFDWDRGAQAWVYRRNKAHLFKLLESELEQLCGKRITLS
ncbi:hypothetical protein LguiA_022640 [Lonicera macranthoides]